MRVAEWQEGVRRLAVHATVEPPRRSAELPNLGIPRRAFESRLPRTRLADGPAAPNERSRRAGKVRAEVPCEPRSRRSLPGASGPCQIGGHADVGAIDGGKYWCPCGNLDV